MCLAELHDYMGGERGRALGMPIDKFTDAAYRGLASGRDQIIIGSIGPEETFHEIIDKRRKPCEDDERWLRTCNMVKDILEDWQAS